jgi:uncharacterized protein
MSGILVDTGPLVAILSRDDQFHQVCVDVLRSLSPPLLTCWPVLTEAAWLLRGRAGIVERLLGSLGSGFLRIAALSEEDAPGIGSILRQYRKLKPQLADAALVHLAAREGIDTVFTLDQRDFRVYRTDRKRALRIVPEL